MKINYWKIVQKEAIVSDISVIIPVFKDSSNLANILDALSPQQVDKEIIVTVDEPTQRFLKMMRIFRGVKLIINKKRLGKVNALNAAVKKSSGKDLLFLDSDIELDDQEFLNKLIDKMEYTDFVDIKKEAVRNKSFLSKMAYYEYMTYGIVAWIQSRNSGQCVGVNGSAFAIRRETFDMIGGFRRVVAEDIDIAIRAFLKGASFEYAKDIAVKNIVHSSWKEWFHQRKRWAVGQALWVKKWWKELATKPMSKPHAVIPAFFFLYPSIIIMMLSLAIPSIWMHQYLLSTLPVLTARFSMVSPVFLTSLATAKLLSVTLVSIFGFAAVALMFMFFSKKLGFKISIPEFFAYYFFFSFLWTAMQIGVMLQVALFKKKSATGWRV